jgi:hypothetical protein
MNTIKWPSLCTPACLPLTTGYLSPIDEPEACDEYTYTISVESEANQDHNVTEESKILFVFEFSTLFNHFYR